MKVDRLSRAYVGLSDRITLVLRVVSVFAVGVSLVLGTVDVITSSFLNKPIAGAIEGVTALMVVITFGILPHLQRRDENIRVEILLARAKSRARAFLDLVAVAVGTVFFGLLAWQGGEAAMRSLERREASSGAVAFPIYPSKMLIVLCLIAILLCIGIDLARGIRQMISGSTSADVGETAGQAENTGRDA